MATLVFGTIGTALGGPLGGAIGALAGRQLDGALFGSQGGSGPRLRELEVSLSSYGEAIPRVYGRMRVAGAIIWATELQEHAELQGAGKSQPALAAYSYTANLAVALSSRPISGLGRIWADGKLLRGAAGDLKVGGILRIHSGGEEQAVDPLIAASEGEGRCPAFRGLAYVVFESLDLADFGNRIPALTFEVIADDGVTLDTLLRDTLPGCEVRHDIEPLAGFRIDDTLGSSLAALAAVIPIAIDAANDTIVISAGGSAEEPVLLDAAASAVDDDAFGMATGHTRRRAPPDAQPPTVLRYLDIDRDFQPGLQHATGRAGPGQADVVELPAAIDATRARALVERLALDRDRARDRLLWRTCTLDSQVAPGVWVRVPGRGGTWRVESWEWREAGVELELVRIEPAALPPTPLPAVDSFPAPVDLPAAQTRMAAFELPWDGGGESPDRPRLVAAVSGTGANWSGAALFAEQTDGQLLPLGHAGRTPAVIGTTLDALASASPLLLDRSSQMTITLGTRQALSSTTLVDLANGGNLALVGDELVQFARAEPLGGNVWRLSQFLRGCGGTEAAIAGHLPGEPFVLVDPRLTPLDPALASGAAEIVALGRGDVEPVACPVRLRGIDSTPLAPVHGRAIWQPDGALRLDWTRRTRGGWRWSDGIDVPLTEEAERYLVTIQRDGIILRGWTVSAPTIVLTSDSLAVPGSVLVQQQGTLALSNPLLLKELA